MSKILKLFHMTLSLFDEGAPAPAAGSGQETTPIDTTGTQGSNQPAPGEKPKVVYGKQPTEQAEGNIPAAGDKTSAEDKAKAFEAMIKGDYADVFNKRVQGVIDRRFSETKTLETKLNGLAPVLDVLKQRYGVEDESKLSEAIMSDNAIWEELADERGLTVQQLQQVMKTERENNQLKAQLNHENGLDYAKKTYDSWLKEAEGLKAEGYEIDIDAEADNNKQFVELLKAGVGVKTAYEVIHMDEIKQNTLKTAQQNVVSNIQAKGLRPSENGANSATGVVVKSDPSKFTDADLKEIRKRVQNGETISF